MKVLMLGWEFPPIISGGLGTACYGLTQSMAKKGIDITFVVPSNPSNCDFLRLLDINRISSNIKIKKIRSILTPYLSSESYTKLGQNYSKGNVYGMDLFTEVYRYTEAVKILAKNEDFDIIHAHDWMSYLAGIEVKKILKKPLVAHVHATEFDRTGGNNVNSYIYEIEKKGLEFADLIISNSNYTKNNIVKHYNINPDKIKPVYLASFDPNCNFDFKDSIKNKNKIVLFLGRLTLQKGPDYFIEVANQVLKFEPNTSFIVAGSGDMLPRLIERTLELNIHSKVNFTGFLTGDDVHKAYQLADVYVMPSVSEPFGIGALESLKNKTPVIISKNSGVSEVLTHVLKVDFWDINEMTNKIVSVLRYKELHSELKENSFEEAKKFNWDKPAEECINAYNEVLKW